MMRREPSFSPKTDLVKEDSKVINHNWVKNHACILPQNNLVVVSFFLIVPKKSDCQQSFIIYRLSCHCIRVRTDLLAVSAFKPTLYLGINSE